MCFRVTASEAHSSLEETDLLILLRGELKTQRGKEKYWKSLDALVKDMKLVLGGEGQARLTMQVLY